MTKTILLTGATDGIGLETAKLLAEKGHTLLLHGRNAEKLASVKAELNQLNSNVRIETFQADLSKLPEFQAMASDIKARFEHLNVLINNAGIFKSPQPITDSGHDIRFLVNTISPYLLTTQLLPLFNAESRIINLSSAAQAPVSLAALAGKQKLSDSDAYAQSKLAITMWTFQLAQTVGRNGPSILAVNPASFLGSKMVKEAYGSQGKDLSIGADILVRAALANDFAKVTGSYFDNDSGNWAQPHADALDESKNNALISEIESILKGFGVGT